jgi:hypothetical protein
MPSLKPQPLPLTQGPVHAPTITSSQAPRSPPIPPHTAGDCSDQPCNTATPPQQHDRHHRQASSQLPPLAVKAHARGPRDRARGPRHRARGPRDRSRGPPDRSRGPRHRSRGPRDRWRGQPRAGKRSGAGGCSPETKGGSWAEYPGYRNKCSAVSPNVPARSRDTGAGPGVPETGPGVPEILDNVPEHLLRHRSTKGHVMQFSLRCVDNPSGPESGLPTLNFYEGRSLRASLPPVARHAVDGRASRSIKLS